MAVDEKVDVFQDFSLGLNTLSAPNRLDPKASPTHSNVWNDDGALAKRLGQNRTSTTNTVFGANWFGYSMHTSVFSGTENLIILASRSVTKNLLMYTSDSINVNPVLISTAGTVTTDVGTTAVVGVGTAFLTTARAGALVVVGSTIGIVSSVTNDTNIVLTANFGAANAGAAYSIAPGFPITARVSYTDQNSKAWIFRIRNNPLSLP